MLIGLVGYASSGKDSVGDVLRIEHGFTRYAFADVLKDFALELDPLLTSIGKTPPWYRLADVVGTYRWDYVKREYPSAREYLQLVGAAVRDKLGPDIWINAVFNAIAASPNPWGNIVITDVRYQNEIDVIRSHFGYIWQVHRPNVGPANAHISEHEWEQHPPDAYVANDGTLNGLRHHVNAVLSMEQLKASGATGFVSVPNP